MIGESLAALLIGSRSRRREAVDDLAVLRSWGMEMEGSVSNLMICNLAYSGKLEELKERILADKSLATRTDQVKQRWILFAGGGGDIVQWDAWRGPSRDRFPEGQIPPLSALSSAKSPPP